MRAASKIVSVGLIVLAGNFTASASPTFVESCFDSEAEASKQQNAYARVDVDNSKTIDLDKRIAKLIGADWESVELASLKVILGEPEGRAIYASSTATHSWSLPLAYTPSAGEIVYDASRGYCVDTRRAPYGAIEFSWTEHFQGSPYGALERHLFYN